MYFSKEWQVGVAVTFKPLKFPFQVRTLGTLSDPPVAELRMFSQTFPAFRYVSWMAFLCLFISASAILTPTANSMGLRVGGVVPADAVALLELD